MFGEVLSKYHIVSKLLALLLHESLDSEEKFSIILTLGHCTEVCGKYWIYLVCLLKTVEWNYTFVFFLLVI